MKAESLFLEKKSRGIRKKVGCKFIRINASDVKRVMIQIMKLVKYKYLLVNLKTKNKRKRKQNKRIRRRNKKVKTSINNSKCFKWIVNFFYQITNSEKHTIKNKTNKN